MILRAKDIRQNDLEVLNMMGKCRVSFEAPIDMSIDTIDFIYKYLHNEYTRSSLLKIKYVTEDIYLNELAKDPTDWKGEFHDNVRIICTEFKDDIKKKYKVTSFTTKDLNLNYRTCISIFCDYDISEDDIKHLMYDISVQYIHLYLNDIGFKSFRYCDEYAHDILTIGRVSFKYCDEYAIALPNNITVEDAIFALDYYEAICEIFASVFNNFDKDKLFDHFPKYLDSVKNNVYNYSIKIKDGTDTDQDFIKLLNKFYEVIK